MYLVKILNADHRPVDVEVSLEIYRVYEESRKQEERQRYERRKHIEGKSFDDCLLYDLATEPLEETVERLETLLEIGNFPRCSGGVSFSIFSTDTPIQRLPKCRTAINRRSCVPCIPL